MSRILVVDDDAAILKLVGFILSKAGYEVRTCAQPREALELLGTFTPDLVISDVVMPYMNGYEFLEHVRENPALAGMPFMLLSSHAERDDVRRGMNLGADDYLPKPFTPQDLTTAVEARLRRAGLKATSASVLEARGFKTASVTYKGQPVQWVSRKATELFFYLLEHGEVSSWEAAEALWPEKDEARASSLFHTTLHRLRRSLDSEAVISQSRRYALASELSPSYDVRNYERQAAGLLRATPDLGLLRELVGLYGEFLPGYDSPWCDEVRARLQEVQMGLLSMAGRQAFASGHHREAAAYHQQALNLDPMSEPDWDALARALKSIGDPRAPLADRREAWWMGN